MGREETLPECSGRGLGTPPGERLQKMIEGLLTFEGFGCRGNRTCSNQKPIQLRRIVGNRKRTEGRRDEDGGDLRCDSTSSAFLSVRNFVCAISTQSASMCVWP